MANSRTLSDRERAIIIYALERGITSKIALYKLAYDGPASKVEGLSDLAATASRWWSSRKIQDFINSESAELKIRRDHERAKIAEEIRAELEEELRTGKRSREGFIDYSRPENQIRLLNELINRPGSPGEQIDALKIMLAEVAKKGAGEGGADIQRFYTPLKCKSCPLYQEAAERLKR